MVRNGKRYAAFLLFSAPVWFTAGFAGRTAAYDPGEMNETVVLDQMFQEPVQVSVCEAGKLKLKPASVVIECDSENPAEGVFGEAAKEAKANAKKREEAKRQEEAKKQAKAQQVSGSTQELLASIIFCEAGNQPYEGQVAVGAVVMNRVKSKAFPDTVEEVIYQSGQFSPAGSGWLDEVRSSGSYTDSAMRAAKDALAGANPVGDCLYFDRGNHGRKIGDHYFH